MSENLLNPRLPLEMFNLTGNFKLVAPMSMNTLNSESPAELLNLA